MGAGMGPLGMAGVTTRRTARSSTFMGRDPVDQRRHAVPVDHTAGEVVPRPDYARGASVQFVPDMWFSSTTHQLVPAARPVRPMIRVRAR